MQTTAINYQYNNETHELFVPRNNEYKPYLGGVGKFYFDRLKELSSDDGLVAQIDGATGATQSFKQLLEASIKLSQHMRRWGIQPGDNITMCAYNHFNSAVVVIAAQFVGAVLSCTDPSMSVEDTTYLLRMVKPKMVFVSDGSEELIAAALNANKLRLKIMSVTLASHDEYESIDHVLNTTTINDDFEPLFVKDLNTVCSILFSSGTTGMPKGISLSHNYFLSAVALMPTLVIKFVVCNYPTFYWISSVYFLAISVQTASARIVLKKFDKETHWETTAKYKTSYLTLSNTYFMEAAKYLTDDLELPFLKLFFVNGGLVPETYLTLYTQKFPKASVGYIYALTEGGLVSQYQPGDKFASNGKPAALGQTVKIVDPNTEENLPLNKVGEIRVKNPYQMTGYYNMDSSVAWDKQGFLKTGDLGYLDDEYNLFTVDRIKEMFKYRGWHIVPAKIENVLGTHPDVLHCVVMGKRTNDEDENHAMAIACLHDGATTSAEDLVAFVNQRMDDINHLRAGVKIIDRSVIQFTPSGKINRNQLKKEFA